jgi:hypothetical protein
MHNLSSLSLLQSPKSVPATDEWVAHIPDFLWRLLGSKELHAPFLAERRTRDRIQGQRAGNSGYLAFELCETRTSM